MTHSDEPLSIIEEWRRKSSVSLNRTNDQIFLLISDGLETMARIFTETIDCNRIQNALTFVESVRLLDKDSRDDSVREMIFGLIQSVYLTLNQVMKENYELKRNIENWNLDMKNGSSDGPSTSRKDDMDKGGFEFNEATTNGVSSSSEDQDESIPSLNISHSPTPSRPNALDVETASTSFSPLPHYTPSPLDQDAPIDSLAPLSVTDKESGVLLYTLSVSSKRVCFFVPSSLKLIEKRRDEVSIPDLKEHEIYLVSAITHDYLGEFKKIREMRRMKYLERNSFTCGSISDYRELILPALLLGCRVRDYEQRCATVTQLGEELVLTMPVQGVRLERLKLKTISGENFDVKVTYVQKDDRRWIVSCLQSSLPLPPSVHQGCLVEIVYDEAESWQSPVTCALFPFHTNKKAAASARPIENWPLFECIYGAPGHLVHPLIPMGDSSIKLKDGGDMKLNSQQAEALAYYNCDSVPAFIIEAPPGSGKTVTAAAMAVAYKGKGVQLFLSTANVPVTNIALALAKLDYGSRSPVHLTSSEYEDRTTEETRSPFSSLALAKNREELKAKIESLENDLVNARYEEERKRARQSIHEVCVPEQEGEHDIYFATLDTIFNRYFKPNKFGSHLIDTVKKQLQERVERVVIDEASQLTEAALNAIVLLFTKAQIVLIGDPKQLPPFRYTKGEVVSELASRSALDVVKEKKNIPVITLTEVYRASQSLIDHYSDIFYDRRLVSHKPIGDTNPVSCYAERGVGESRCVFWKVNNGASFTPKNSTSKVNKRERVALEYITTQLKNCGIGEKDVMIICLYEAQRKEAESKLPGYEVLTVDSAQGREKRVVIVLTTRSSVSADANEDFFNSPKRCNVAVSRHQEALIVLGHPSIASAPNWKEVLDTKYFKHIEDDSTPRYF